MCQQQFKLAHPNFIWGETQEPHTGSRNEDTAVILEPELSAFMVFLYLSAAQACRVSRDSEQ